MQLLAALLLIVGLVFFATKILQKEGGADLRKSYQTGDSKDEDRDLKSQAAEGASLKGFPRLEKDIKDQLDRSDRKELDALIDQVDK